MSYNIIWYNELHIFDIQIRQLVYRIYYIDINVSLIIQYKMSLIALYYVCRVGIYYNVFRFKKQQNHTK